VAHHFFSTAPFYNLPEITKAIKPVLGPYYAYDTTSTFRALWRSFTECKFVEDDGQVLFFKDMKGKALIDVDSTPAN
jgi:fatty acid desaturase